MYSLFKKIKITFFHKKYFSIIIQQNKKAYAFKFELYLLSIFLISLNYTLYIIGKGPFEFLCRLLYGKIISLYLLSLINLKVS